MSRLEAKDTQSKPPNFMSLIRFGVKKRYRWEVEFEDGYVGSGERAIAPPPLPFMPIGRFSIAADVIPFQDGV